MGIDVGLGRASYAAGESPNVKVGPRGRVERGAQAFLRFARRHAALATLAPFLLVGAVRASWFSEGDTFWQVQTGEEILRRHTVFLTDDFSWTVPGRAWHPNSWLFDLLLTLAYRNAGRVGLGLFALLLVVLLGVAVGTVARSLGARSLPLLVTSSLFLVPLLAWLTTRPQTVTYCLLLLTLLLAARAVQARGRRLVLAIGGVYLLTALWMNLHLAALGILPAAGAGLLAAAVVHRGAWRRTVPVSGALLTAMVLGCASSPLGFGAVTSALATRDASSSIVTEWAPLWQTSLAAVLTWVAAAIACALAGAAWRRRSHDRLLAMCTAGALVLLLLGVSAARFSPMALVVALPGAAAWATDVRWTRGWLRPRIAFFGTGIALGWLPALLVVALVHLPDLGVPAATEFPAPATVDAIPAHCRVLNEYVDGGYLTLRRQSDGIQVAMDGRNDVYGAALIAHLEGLLNGSRGALSELTRDHVGCLLLNPQRPLVAMALAAGWQPAARDPHRLLLMAPVSPQS